MVRRLMVAAAVLCAVTAALPAAAAGAPPSPPPLTTLTGKLSGSGDLFLTPIGDNSAYAYGPEILGRDGKIVWFHPILSGQVATDFRTQRYDGRPVLTWWQGAGFGGLSEGADYIYNDHYQQIAVVHAGNGMPTDGHEFLVTPWNTALVLSYVVTTADLTSIGGPADQTVVDGVVQEVDIRTGAVLWQWNSADHVSYAQSEAPLPSSAGQPWDWFHLNSVHVDTDGNLLINSRHTWTTYKVDRHTGKIIWQLGGKASSFTLTAAPGLSLNRAGAIFAWQHDPVAIAPGVYTYFDNESNGPAPELANSRVLTVRVDERDRVATLIAADNQPDGLLAPSQGSAQTLPNGDVFVGWGALPYVSEFDHSGRLLFNARLPAGVDTYRAYLLPWPGTPS